MLRRSLSSAAGAAAGRVGILAMDAYTPQRFIAQELLETDPGKITIGLGQQEMAFTDDREDVISIMMTALDRLLVNTGVSPEEIGRLEIGTESLVDKSKSAKTTIQEYVFGPGHHNIEGCTSINACYGGTAAVLNSAAWVESSAWDGRYAVVVAGDVAVYEEGPARPTGGCGAVAMLIGRDAPLALAPIRSTHSSDVYDFYKPNLLSEYPTVDGQLSQACYLRALDSCVMGFGSKAEESIVSRFDHLVFHSPYSKLVQQSSRRAAFADAVRRLRDGEALPDAWEPALEFVTAAASGGDAYEETLSSKTSRVIDKAVLEVEQRAGAAVYDMVADSDWASKRVGNTYTGAVWLNLLALLEKQGAGLDGKKVGMFSYGSGAIATLFELEGTLGSGQFKLDRIAELAQMRRRLDERTAASVEEFLHALRLREESYGKASFQPAGSIENIPQGAFYLDSVDDLHRRTYRRNE